MYEHSQKAWSASQEESSYQKPILIAPSRLQNSEESVVCGLSHPGSVTFYSSSNQLTHHPFFFSPQKFNHATAKEIDSRTKF